MAGSLGLLSWVEMDSAEAGAACDRGRSTLTSRLTGRRGGVDDGVPGADMLYEATSAR